jgi:hypothetical protein
MPCVLGIGEMGPGLDKRLATEEITKLHEHEGEEECVQSTQRDPDLCRREREPGCFRAEGGRREEPVLLASSEQIAQQAGREPGQRDWWAD